MLNRMVFLAARTARSQAYAQAMAAAGFAPSQVIIYGPDKGLLGQTGAHFVGTHTGGILVPDLSEPVEDTCRRHGWDTRFHAADNVNDPELAQMVAAGAPSLVVFSAYGGQIVKSALLEGAPLLHMHAGWLPDYRGSTTAYYSWLNGDGCAVTAFLLAAGIDTGPILLRKRYPPPPSGIDMDYQWDGAMRADTLLAVLDHIRRTGALPPPLPQIEAEGRTYYTIHPLLKHLALLQREGKR